MSERYDVRMVVRSGRLTAPVQVEAESAKQAVLRAIQGHQQWLEYINEHLDDGLYSGRAAVRKVGRISWLNVYVYVKGRVLHIGRDIEWTIGDATSQQDSILPGCTVIDCAPWVAVREPR